jgi:hypothetical protein
MKNLFNLENMVGISAFFIASCAAYFSILGIGMLFSGSHIAAMIMALSLELGKLVGTSFLYRHWNKTKTFLKTYLIIAILVLMMITSLGIFGYLSSAYQSSSIENKLTDDRISVIENQKKYSQDKIEESKKRIINITAIRNSQEKRLNESLNNALIARNPIALETLQQQTQDSIAQSQKNLEDENAKIQKSVNELQQFDKQISEFKLQNGNKKDIITFKFVAEALHMDLNTVVKWFIVILITVFDPLAICLLLAYNTTLNKEERGDILKDKEKEKIDDIINEARHELKDTSPLESKSSEIEAVGIPEKVAPVNIEPITPPDVAPPANPVMTPDNHRMRGLFSF